MDIFYETVNKICKDKGTTATTVLREIGASTGNVSKWKKGSIPNIDLALRFAQHLGVSLDYLVTGIESGATQLSVVGVSESEREWLSIIHAIPEDKQEMCKDFLRTHMAVPEKYADRKRG